MNELRAALELATEDELQDFTEILFRRKFNPLDYLKGVDPHRVPSSDRQVWIQAIEERFLFLAADGLTVLRGQAQRISYRQILMQVCRYLKLKFSPSLSTTELEAEIFLSLMQRTWEKMPAHEQQQLTERIRLALQQSTTDPLPLHCHSDSLRLLMEGGSALAISSMVRPLILRKIAQQFAIHFTALQAARGAVAGATPLQGQLLLKTAQQGLASTALRYGATRSLFAALGCALWAGFFIDLGWRAIATNYARIIPMIFTLAQIRLTRSDWSYAI